MALNCGSSLGYAPGAKDKPQRNMKTRPLDLEMKLEVVTPFLGKYRPFVGRCCQRCTPKSWESCFNKHLTALGFCSVIKITEENTRYRGWLVRRLCYFLATCGWDFSAGTQSDLQERIFHSKRVQDIVSQRAPRGKKDAPVGTLSVSQWARKIQQILAQMQSPLSPFLLRLCFWALLKLLNQMFFNTIIHRGQMEMVRRAVQPGVPLVLLSTHKSQLDGLLLPLLLVSQGLGMPRVTWEYKTYTPKHSSFALYVEELLLSRQPLLVFLEEPFRGAPLRSASSREWLGLVVDALHAGRVPDVTVVPVGLSYDAAPDWVHGGRGDPPQALSLWLSLWSLCRAAFRGFGCVRVDFAQPFSLQEYIANNVFQHRSRGKSLEELLLPELLGRCSGPLDCEKRECWPPGSRSAVALTEEQQALVDSLSLHSLSAGAACSSIMSVAIMSALLLHKHREGVFLSRLMRDFVWLTEEVLLRNHDVGFSGQVRHVVMHALALLRGSVSLHRLSLGDVLVAPRRTEAAVRELSQKSAALLPVFAQEAVGACAINALLVEVLPYLESPEQLQDVILVQEELHNKTLQLVQLLPREVLLRQPCEPVYYYCQVVVDKLVQCGVLVAEEVPGDHLVCDTAQQRFVERLLWKATDDFGDSDSDGGEEASKRCFKLSGLESSASFFAFLCRLLGPLLRTLERVAVFLQESEDSQPESQYMENLHRFLVRMAKEDCSPDCANRSLATIAVGVYKELGVLREEPGPVESTLYLSETFIAQENLEKLEQFIEQFIYL
ncbi:hypothetical protein lerEdw1_019807 [Lerista edwardsae]|nr:hypothetical protein lerEdw1_019807 [Lerista edwardsae]